MNKVALSREKVLFSSIELDCVKKGSSQKTNEQFAQLCNCSPRTIDRHLKNLLDQNKIKRKTEPIIIASDNDDDPPYFKGSKRTITLAKETNKY